MKTTEERIKELEVKRQRIYDAIDALINLEDNGPLTNAMSTVLDELRIRQSSFDCLISGYEEELS